MSTAAPDALDDPEFASDCADASSDGLALDSDVSLGEADSDGVALSDAESLDNADVSLSDPPHADNGTSIVPARIAAISLVSERPLEKTPRVIFEYWRSPAPPELLM